MNFLRFKCPVAYCYLHEFYSDKNNVKLIETFCLAQFGAITAVFNTAPLSQHL